MLLALRTDRERRRETPWCSNRRRMVCPERDCPSPTFWRRSAPFAEVGMRRGTDAAIRQPLHGIRGRPAYWGAISAWNYTAFACQRAREQATSPEGERMTVCSMVMRIHDRASDHLMLIALGPRSDESPIERDRLVFSTIDAKPIDRNISLGCVECGQIF